MSNEHTQGRLIVKGGYSLYAEDGKTPVADTCLTNSIPDKDEANARRLAACWNACEGISTENLETNLPVKELAERYNAALSEHDELLTALKDLVNSATEVIDATDDELRDAIKDGDPETRCQAAAFLQARAAIAKAEGSAA